MIRRGQFGRRGARTGSLIADGIIFPLVSQPAKSPPSRRTSSQSRRSPPTAPGSHASIPAPFAPLLCRWSVLTWSCHYLILSKEWSLQFSGVVQWMEWGDPSLFVCLSHLTWTSCMWVPVTAIHVFTFNSSKSRASSIAFSHMCQGRSKNVPLRRMNPEN